MRSGGEALAISVLRGETAVLKHFQARMPYGLVVPDVKTELTPTKPTGPEGCINRPCDRKAAVRHATLPTHRDVSAAWTTRRLGMAMEAREWKIIGLQILAGLSVAFVRHDLERGRVLWDSFEQFLVSWFVHTAAVVVLMVIAIFLILRFHKFFFGYEHEGSKNKYEELGFYILMTVIAASISIFFVAHYGPTDDYDY
jgi:hypothetical protein